MARFHLDTSVIPALSTVGALLSGAKLLVRLKGTTTLSSSWNAQTGGSTNTNPVVANSAGRFGPIWLDADTNYRITVTNADGSDTLYDSDGLNVAIPANVALYTTLAGTGGAALIGSSTGETVETRLTLLEQGEGLFTALVATPPTIAAEVKHIWTTGYREVGKGAGRYLRWAAPVPALPAGGEDDWWFTDADGAQWYPDSYGINFYQFGAYGDYVRTDPDSGTVGNDDYAAFLNYKSWAEWVRGDFDAHPNYRTIPVLRIPFGNYYSSDTFDFDFGSVGWVADYLGGQNGGNPVEFTFADGKTGFRIHSHDTEEDTTRTAAIGAFSSYFFGIVARTNGANGMTDADGWRLRSTTVLHYCSAMNFIRHGVNLTASIGAGTSTEGNTNISKILGGHFKQNGGSGIHADGADANACEITGVNCYGNGRWGIYDGSFLGNFHSGCHCDSNGILGTSGTTYSPNTVGAMTSYDIGGQWKKFAVIQGQEVGAKTNAPALVSDYWAYMEDVAGAAATYPAWVNNARDYLAGGSFAGDGANNRTLFVGCYAEGGQPPPQGGALTAFIQCFIDPHHGGASLIATFDKLISNGIGLSRRRSDGQYMNFLLGGNAATLNLDVLANFGNDAANSPPWFWKANDSSDFYVDYSHGEVPVYVCGGSTTVDRGSAGEEIPYGVIIKNLFVGSTTSANQITFGTAAPASGFHKRGDVHFRSDATASQNAGWMCTASGTPGTWKAMSNLAA